MRKLIFLAVLATAACSPAQVAQLATINAVVCKVDGQLQPVVVPLDAAVATAVAPGSAPVIAGAVALDTNLVHPAVVAACAAIGGTAVAGK